MATEAAKSIAEQLPTLERFRQINDTFPQTEGILEQSVGEGRYSAGSVLTFLKRLCMPLAFFRYALRVMRKRQSWMMATLISISIIALSHEVAFKWA